METQYIKLAHNENFILTDPIEDNTPDESEDLINDNIITVHKQNKYNLQNNIIYQSIESKLKNSSNIKFDVLQKWEGIVENIDGEIIQVKLIDLTNGGTDEEAELSIEDIPEDDKRLVREGAMFYWSIGYITQKNGQILKSSLVKFRRLPKIEPKKFDEIHDLAKELESKIIFD